MHRFVLRQAVPVGEAWKHHPHRDGSISIKVNSIVSDTELKGTVLNSKKLGERKNCNLPGVKVDIPS